MFKGSLTFDTVLTWMEYAAVAGGFVGSIIGAIVLTILGLRAKNGKKKNGFTDTPALTYYPMMTKLDFVEAMREQDQQHAEDSSKVYAKLELFIANSRLDADKYDGRLAEIGNQIDMRLRGLEQQYPVIVQRLTDIDRRLGSVEQRFNKRQPR